MTSTMPRAARSYPGSQSWRPAVSDPTPAGEPDRGPANPVPALGAPGYPALADARNGGTPSGGAAPASHPPAGTAPASPPDPAAVAVADSAAAAVVPIVAGAALAGGHVDPSAAVTQVRAAIERSELPAASRTRPPDRSCNGATVAYPAAWGPTGPSPNPAAAGAPGPGCLPVAHFPGTGRRELWPGVAHPVAPWAVRVPASAGSLHRGVPRNAVRPSDRMPRQVGGSGFVAAPRFAGAIGHPAGPQGYPGCAPTPPGAAIPAHLAGYFAPPGRYPAPGAAPADLVGTRCGQFLADGALSGITSILLWLLLGGLSLGADYLFGRFAPTAYFVIAVVLTVLQFIAPVAASWFFQAYWPSRHDGQTVAMRWFRLRVVMREGTPLRLGALSLRWLILPVDQFLLIGLFVAISGPLGQRVGDRAAGTVVVRAG